MVTFTWALLFKEDFKSLTLIDAGIPGLLWWKMFSSQIQYEVVNFIFQVLPDLPAELIDGNEDIYVG